MEVLDFSVFITDGRLTESAFFEKVDQFDWDAFRDKAVLVRGCKTAIIPPWAFMAVASRLAQVARRVQFGSEHSPVTVFTRPT